MSPEINRPIRDRQASNQLCTGMHRSVVRAHALLMLLAVFILPTATVSAQAPGGIHDSGFLSVYGKLTEAPEGSLADLLYVAPGTAQKLAKYDSVMIDQPIIALSPDSKVKHLKPDDQKALADFLRTGMISVMKSSDYNVVEQAGPTVVYVKVALVNLELEKKKHGILSFTPIGFIATSAADAAKKLMKKVDVHAATVEMEVADSTSGEVYIAAVLKAIQGRGQDVEKKDRYSFGTLQAEFETFAVRAKCRLDNARNAGGQQVNCMELAAAQMEKAKK